MVKILVKHGKRTFEVETESLKTLSELQGKINELTEVPLERQTLVVKGKKLKTNEAYYTLENGQKVLLIGSSAAAIRPKTKTIFIEDLPKEKFSNESHPGLINVGNTCYMNSVIQIIAGMDELSTPLIKYSKDKKCSTTGNLLLVQLGELLEKLQKKSNVITPTEFWTFLVQTYPQLGSKNELGLIQQQDAEECFSLLINLIREEIPEETANILNGKLSTTLKCLENSEEKKNNDENDFIVLKCHINIKTTNILDGIKEGFEETINMRGDNSDINCEWKKQSFLEKLPKYLVVHFVRFFWKKEIQKKSKIMKRVSFPIDSPLNVYSICSEKLQKELGVGISDINDEIPLNSAKVQIENSAKVNSPNYQLESLVTHNGPYADSGHYVAWRRLAKVHDKWNCFNDDKVTEVDTSDIEKLDGGGEWHSAYLVVFKRLD